MKIRFYIFIFALNGGFELCSAQSIINGSFEIGSEGCESFNATVFYDPQINFHLENVEGVVPIHSFPHESYVSKYDCVYPTDPEGNFLYVDTILPDGEYALGLWSRIYEKSDIQGRSGVTLLLNAPIIQGHHYSLSYYISKQEDPFWWFDINAGLLEVGVSNDPISFGETAYMADSAENHSWIFNEIELIAPITGNYLSIRCVSPEIGQHYLQVDDLVLNHLHGPLPDIHVFEEEDVHSNMVISTLDDVDLKIFPNPANDLITVGVDGGMLPQSLHIMDQYGNLLRVFETNSSIQKLDIGFLSQGVYYISGEGIRPRKISVIR